MKPLTPLTWTEIFANACALFDDLEGRGFGKPPFSLGGGTVLMFRFKHRLSKDLDFFGYDAQWLSLLSPRLNGVAAAMARDYSEQANGVKIIMPSGDIDFIVAGDIATPVEREALVLQGRETPAEPTSEILAKKLFYRAAAFKARDVYDMSAAIDLDPASAAQATRAAASRKDQLLRRLEELGGIAQDTLLEGIVPYDGRLPHADAMVSKVRSFIQRVPGGARPAAGNPDGPA